MIRRLSPLTLLLLAGACHGPDKPAAAVAPPALDEPASPAQPPLKSAGVPLPGEVTPVSPFAPVTALPDRVRSTDRIEISVAFDPGLAAFSPDLAGMIAEETDFDVSNAEEMANRDAEESGDMFRSHAIDIRWTVSAIAGDLISFDKSGYVYTGGAHPLSFTDARLYDRAGKRVLDEAGLFAEPAAYYGRLVDTVMPRLVAERVARTQGVMAAQDAEAEVRELLLPEPAQWSSVSLLPSTQAGQFGGLMVHFNPYDIGPYAEGSYDIAVPQAEFADLLKPEYREIFAGEPVLPPKSE